MVGKGDSAAKTIYEGVEFCGLIAGFIANGFVLDDSENWFVVTEKWENFFILISGNPNVE